VSDSFAYNHQKGEKGQRPLHNGHVPFVILGDAMNQISPIIRLLTYQESIQAGIQIRALVLEHHGNCYHLEGGTRDTIYVYQQSISIFVLTINKANGYLSLNAYMTPQPDPINSLFLHNNKEIRETVGHRWESMKPLAIVQKLIQCLC
jgi:hypothetical protein